MVEEWQKIKYEITTGLFSRWERHIFSLWATPSPYLKIYVASATRELVIADVASLTCWVDFTEKFSAALGSLSGVMTSFLGPLFRSWGQLLMCSSITSMHLTFLEPSIGGLKSGSSMRGSWGGRWTSHEPQQLSCWSFFLSYQWLL
jgi:hypothetical protein